MASMSISTPFGFAVAYPASVSPSPSAPRNLLRFAPSASLDHGGLHSRTCGLSLKLNAQTQHHNALRKSWLVLEAINDQYVDELLGTRPKRKKNYAKKIAIEAKKGNPPIMPAVMTPGGPLDLSSVLFRNRIIFVGQPVNALVAQCVISQLLTLASIDEDADILVYLNCPGGNTYSVLAIYDCMSWIKPKVGTVCFGVAASQGALLLDRGEKGMCYAMPNALIMICQPQGGCGGHVGDVRRPVKEAVQSRHINSLRPKNMEQHVRKIDKIYAAFTGQPLEKVQRYTERDCFFSSSEALEFELIDGVLET